MDHIAEDVKNYYQHLDSLSDPRSRGWFLVPSIYSPLSAVAIYCLIVKVGPRIMENFKPLELRIPMFVYNFGATALNLYCFLELLIGSTLAGYSYGCESVLVSTEPKHMRVTNAVWWFYISKYYEMLDTVFFILRKKDSQISFLHVYHHTSILVLWWIGVKWVPGGTAFYSSMLNAFVHVVMYTYYGLSTFPSLRKYLWWKRYLTQLQLTQFFAFTVQAFYGLYLDCGFPRWMGYGMLLYMVSMVTLFGNFYYQAYNRTVKSKHEEVLQNGASVNGVQTKND